MINETLLSYAVEPLVDGKFCLGDMTKGWDCLDSLYAIYSKLGIDFPTEWRDYNIRNYAERWKKNESDCRKDFKEFLCTLGEKLENPNFMRAGDLLLFETAELPMCPAIYVGSGKMIMVWSKKVGVKTVPLNPLRKYLREVRRLIK